MGNVEISYLGKLSPSERLLAFDRLFSFKIPALIIARNTPPVPECIAMAQKHNITVLRSKEATSTLLSSIITGMPPAAMLPSMMVECGVYGLVTGLMMKFIRTGKLLPDLYISMLTAMALGRIVSGLAKALIFTPGTAPFAWVTTSLVSGIPGIVIQLVLMPLVIFALTRARLIPVRYPKGETV